MATERSTTGATAPHLDLGWLKQALTFLGVAGSGGGGFAVLCFGIGFLAIRSHDEMLGLPSRSTAYSAMVRTGALFFPNSLYYAFVATYDALIAWWKPIAILSAVALVSWLFKNALATGLHRLASRVPAALRSWWRRTRLPLAHTLLLAWALLLGGLLFETRAATFHRTNRHLLLETADPDAEKAPFVSLYREVERLDRISTKAARIRAELRSDVEATRVHYGGSVALLALFVASLVVELLNWRELRSRLLRWAVRPALYVVATVLVVTLPAAYGVLWIPNSATSVQIATTGAASEPLLTAYLLTEISSDEPDVWTLREYDPLQNEGGTQRTFVMRVFKRENISEIRVIAEGFTDNLLKEASGTASDEAQGGDRADRRSDQ